MILPVAQIATGSSLNRILYVLQVICNSMEMVHSFGYGATEDFNASNNTLMPAIWVEPNDSKEFNYDNGVRVEELALNVYCIDRINKGDNNFQDIHSDTKYTLQSIVAIVRESAYTRYQWIGLTRRDLEYKPVVRWSDENCNGWMCKLIFRVPVQYNPCNTPIIPPPAFNPQWNGLMNVVDAGNDHIFADNPQVFVNVVDAGVDEVYSQALGTIINVVDAQIDTDSVD